MSKELMLNMFEKMTVITEGYKPKSEENEESVDEAYGSYYSKTGLKQKQSDGRWAKAGKEWDEPDEKYYAKKAALDAEWKQNAKAVKEKGFTSADTEAWFEKKGIKPTSAGGYEYKHWNKLFKDMLNPNYGKAKEEKSSEPAPNKFAIAAVKKKWDTLDDTKKQEYIAKYGAKNLGVNEGFSGDNPQADLMAKAVQIAIDYIQQNHMDLMNHGTAEIFNDYGDVADVCNKIGKDLINIAKKFSRAEATGKTPNTKAEIVSFVGKSLAMHG